MKNEDWVRNLLRRRYDGGIGGIAVLARKKGEAHRVTKEGRTDKNLPDKATSKRWVRRKRDDAICRVSQREKVG